VGIEMPVDNKKYKDMVFIPHNHWAYLVTTRLSSKYIPTTILITSETPLTIEDVVKMFKTEDNPDTYITKLEHVDVNAVWINKAPVKKVK
jgi:hypothetical protein